MIVYFQDKRIFNDQATQLQCFGADWYDLLKLSKLGVLNAASEYNCYYFHVFTTK